MKITLAQRGVLKILAAKPRIDPWEQTHRVYPFGSALLGRMEKRGLVECFRHTTDQQREFGWRITAAGWAALEEKP